MQVYDAEGRKKVARHQRLRAGKGFQTIEQTRDIHKAAEIIVRDRKQTENAALLECMSNLTANEMYQENGSGDACVQEILKGIHHVLSHSDHLVFVTNEIFSDGIEYDPETTRYQQYLGEMNCELAKLADVVVEVVYSIPLEKKGTLKGIVS